MAITNPNDFASTQVWLDAQQHSASNDDPVSTATDYHTGGGNDFTGASDVRPLYKTNIHNGHPIFRFDGTDDVLSKAMSIAQPLTVGLFLAKRSTGFAVNRGIICGTGFGGLIYAEADSPERWALYSGTGSVFDGNIDTSFHTIIAVFNGASSLIRVDGSETTGNPGIVGYVTPITIGSNTDSPSGTYSDVDVGEVVICNAALSAGNITDLEAYFTAHWAAAATAKPYYYHRNQ